MGTWLPQTYREMEINIRNSSTVQALRLCTGRTAHSGSRGIDLLYRHLGSVQAVRPIGEVEV
jgi:hypothetical protein